MIRINLPRETRWLTLGQGVEVLVRPLTTAIYRAATTTAWRKVNAVAEERGLIEDAGGRISDIPDPTNRDGMEGLRQQFMVQDLAVHAIAEWRGVGGPNGEDAPLTPANVCVLIRDFPLQAMEFETQYLRELVQMSAEGNGSRLAQNGTGAAEPDTAAGASPSAAESAPTTSTPPQPSMETHPGAF